MTVTHFTHTRIVTPGGVIEGALSVASGMIVSIGDDAKGGNVIDLGGDWLLPGFIDTQVNGGGGVLFNDAPTVETIRAIGAAHAAFGTTGFLPTLITDDLAAIDTAMRAVEAAIEAGVPGVLGIHIEGPFINVARKGIHDSAKIRALDADSLALLSSLKRGRTLVTLAPELCTPDDLRALTGAGVVIAAGHTDADYDTMRAALGAGVTGFTHLFNAMSPLGHRAPGVVGAALDDQASYCGIIVDGHHVHPAALRIALRAKPIDRFMLVSDAMSTVGTDMTEFLLDGRPIEVRDGVLRGADGTLAGSSLDMASALRNVIAMTNVTLADAATMAAAAPAGFLGIAPRHGTVSVGARADLVRMTPDLAVKDVWIGGNALRADAARARSSAPEALRRAG